MSDPAVNNVNDDAIVLQNVNCNIVGEESLTDKLLGKRRNDEEDYWPDTDEERAAIEKRVQESQASIEGDDSTLDIIEPPLRLTGLVTAYEESNSLRQNIDAMVTNIDGFGFTLEPVVSWDTTEFSELITDKLEEEDITADEQSVGEEKKRIRREAMREKRSIKQFLAFCADDSFIELRRASREDLEVLGNFTWEVLRNNEDHKIARFVHLPFYTMRLCKKGKPVKVEVKRKIDPITWDTVEELKRFRRFVQIIDGRRIYFKEFGDPRIMSKKTGHYYDNPEELAELKSYDPNEGEATEVLHYKIPAIRGAYGMPRWIGNILSVLGSRLAEEVNFFYFSNKGIPPMIIFVENGRLRDGATDRLADFMKEIKGSTKNFWKIAILEGESADDARKSGNQWTGNARFKVVRLTSEQLKDALFQEYDANNRDKVGESFRIPRLLRGDVRDFNRATAITAKTFGEEQVFQPERDRFDAWFNRIIGPELSMTYWLFKTLAPIVRDPLNLTDMVTKLVKAGILVPAEARKISEDIFNRDFAEINEPWTKQPLQLSLASTYTDGAESTGEEVAKSIRDRIDKMSNDELDSEAFTKILDIYDSLSRQSLLPEQED